MADSDTIDRRSATPYYQQLVNVLEERIGTGQIRIGAKLPSENELRQEFGLSRATIRQALRSLEARGTVNRIANRGAFAASPEAEHGWVIQAPEGFLENAFGHQNRAVTTSVLGYRHVELPAYAAHSLDVPEGSQGFELVRVRTLDGTPALFSTNYSPGDVAPIIADDQDVLTGRSSFSELLARHGYTLGGAHRTIIATSPTPDVAHALDTATTQPLLRIRSVSWTPTGERYDLYETWVRSDVIPLEINVTTHA